MCIRDRAGKDPRPEIMIPLVGHVNKLKATRVLLDAEAEAVVKAAGVRPDFKFGTMIEIPRACWVADEIAEHAQFFSFGTNDLTQMTFGYSRDDAEGGFLLKYVEDKILPYNPFQSLDPVIVQEMKMAVDLGRKTRPDLKVGICGEHGGDPMSIGFFHDIGLNYVSCSPFRVPVARLAAAPAALAGAAERDKEPFPVRNSNARRSFAGHSDSRPDWRPIREAPGSGRWRTRSQAKEYRQGCLLLRRLDR